MNPALGCLIGEPVGILVAGDPNVGWHPEGRDLVVPAHYARAGLDCGSGQVLALANGVRPGSVDGRCRVCEDGVAAAALLPERKKFYLKQ